MAAIGTLRLGFTFSGNTGPPLFQILKHVKVENRDIVTLDSSLFYMSDPDLPTESLVIIVEELPSNGDIIIASEGKDAKVNKGENFTVQDIENGMVRFKHHKGDDQKGKSFNPVSHW